ncbi:hypothetical protein VK792_07555 [Mesobacterium sp. TK19101]|uniref:Uncharacterized protein n=1 Tax=Mesobacterium hydrothermale TaxID=3111907 RepID=A0ABU6HF94_9RHOB|nr:hypothetical protein [Mesobacterium sp. TK19101]MEC3861135.1 hypothetical protein [Mesobacterium sp. TK19101]
MPIEVIAILMALVPLSVAFMDVWDDPKDDPRAQAAARPATGTTPGIQRRAVDTAGHALGCRLSGKAPDAAPRLRRPIGPTLTLKTYPLPAPDAVTGWEWYDLAKYATDFGPTDFDALLVVTRSKTALLDSTRHDLPQDWVSFGEAA